jgi:hypothetical protein
VVASTVSATTGGCGVCPWVLIAREIVTERETLGQLQDVIEGAARSASLTSSPDNIGSSTDRERREHDAAASPPRGRSVAPFRPHLVWRAGRRSKSLDLDDQRHECHRSAVQAFPARKPARPIDLAGLTDTLIGRSVTVALEGKNAHAADGSDGGCVGMHARLAILLAPGETNRQTSARLAACRLCCQCRRCGEHVTRAGSASHGARATWPHHTL